MEGAHDHTDTPVTKVYGSFQKFRPSVVGLGLKTQGQHYDIDSIRGAAIGKGRWGVE